MLYEKEVININPCPKCGVKPRFIIPNDHYTDCWLECPICGRQTINTGGYHYAREIPLKEAKLEAIKLWDNGECVDG